MRQCVYQRTAEEILGKLIADCRDELVITSKVFGRTGEHANAGGLSRRHVVQAVEDSLRRLNTDRLDIYFVHQYDVHTPIEEVVDVVDELVRQGKILYPAVSNWSAWQTAKAIGVAERKDKVRFACLQPMYNLTKRQAEVELLPLADSEGLGVIPYNPVGGGLLAGKYSKGAKPKSGRLVENSMYATRYHGDVFFEVAERFVAHAKERDVHPVSLAVAWVGAHPAVTAPIIGARNPEQLQASLAAVDVNMTAEWRAEISDLSPPPAVATDRSEERP